MIDCLEKGCMITRGWTATNMNAQKKLFTVCAIGPIRLLALASYKSLTNQILIFGILDLNFSLNFNSMQAAVLPSLSYSVESTNLSSLGA